MIAWLNLRHQQSERAEMFSAGLRRLGYTVEPGLTFSPKDEDVLCTWSRIGDGDKAARTFQARGLPVLVTENATWGNELAGHRWLTLSKDFHNVSSGFTVGSNERWDSLQVELQPFRSFGETVFLPQRGIGPTQTAMPPSWLTSATQRFEGRVRKHPGRRPATPLREDLAYCGRVVTWGSGAAVKALMWGVKVESDMPNWIGQQNNTDEGRLAMFRRLAWAQATHEEIADGSAFERLLNG